jgi:thioredoxin-like negative regulator of GroEL
MIAANPTPGVRPSGTSILGLIVALVAVIAGLLVVDSTLERAEQRELQSSAERNFTQGLRLLREGRAKDAVDPLRKAHALERDNTDYELELIDALIGNGKTAEAEPLVNEILLREPNDGRANLTAAHLMVKEGKTTDAESYYHRAIYGEWADNAPAHRVSARMELVQLLVGKGKKEALLAELLPLQAEAKKNVAIQKSLGHLFLIAGAPERSAEVYHALIAQNPKDAEAYAGLGEVLLEQGDYRAAHSAFLAASSHAQDDTLIRLRLELLSTLTSLDPTPRRLPSLEKYRRSVRILQLADTDLNGCIAKHPPPVSDETAQLLSTGQTTLAAQPTTATNELSEGVLSLAEKTWQARLQACGPSTSSDEEPLRLIMGKLAQ